MAETPSTMLPLGTPAPDFALPDPKSGKTVALADFADKPALLVAFLCNHCPYVKRIREGFAALAREFQEKGAGVVGIMSNDFEAYSDDAPEKIVEEIEAVGYTFPYLVDESQAVAKAYRAACTPDFFLFDGNRKLVYRGQMDGARPGNDVPATGDNLRAALDAVLSGAPVPGDQRPSLGCNIKWKPGNEPGYVG